MTKHEWKPKQYFDNNVQLKWGQSLPGETLAAMDAGEIFTLCDPDGNPHSKVLKDSYGEIREQKLIGPGDDEIKISETPQGIEFCGLRADQHELKTGVEPFSKILSGLRKFYLLKQDGRFQVGDRLHLRERNGEEFTGRRLSCLITYILDPVQLPEPWVIVSIRLEDKEAAEQINQAIIQAVATALTAYDLDRTGLVNKIYQPAVDYLMPIMKNLVDRQRNDDAQI